MSKKLKLFAQFKKRAIFENRGNFRSGLRDEALACLREKSIGKRTTRDKEIIHAFLTRTAKYFSSLSPKVLRRYLDFLYHRRYSHRQTVFAVGEPQQFFLVLSGQVTISKPVSRSTVTAETVQVMKPSKVCFLGDIYNENIVETAKRGYSIFEAKAECKSTSQLRESRIRLRSRQSGKFGSTLERPAVETRAATTENGSGNSQNRSTTSPSQGAEGARQNSTDVVDLLLIDFERLECANTRARMEHIIDEFEIFHDLRRDVVQQIVEGATMSHFKAGEIIQREHQTPEVACLILSGVASVQWPVEGETIGADRQWIAAAASSKTTGASGAGRGSAHHTVNVLQLCKGELASLLETTHGVACPYRLVAAERVEALLLPKKLLKLFPRDRRELMQATAYAVMESWRERVHDAVQFVCQASSGASPIGADLTKRPREWGLDGRTLTNPRVDRSKANSGKANATGRENSNKSGRGHDHDPAAPAGINAYESVLRSFHTLSAVARARQGEQVRINQHEGKAAAKEAAKLAARNKALKASGEGGSGPGDTSMRSPEEMSARARARWKSVSKLATFVTRTSKQAVSKSNSVITDKVVQTLLKGHGGGDAAKELHRKIGTKQAHDKLTSMLEKLRQRRAIDDQMSFAMGKKVRESVLCVHVCRNIERGTAVSSVPVLPWCLTIRFE